MELLLCRIVGLLLSWMVICPVDKKNSLKECIDKIKTVASRVLWLPFVSSQVTTRRYEEAMKKRF
ncbi:hypothetical protein BDA96_06G001400 [Sorghum bicolor]|jgi:hypothetical protein|uniref:Uncharacterized protein n=1 Tax=Sorghum bicolor TaxID=4558 RepID=A0A921QN81_SORBI|nr:hypothetical protein BDA96_06G001400 [Sorghum bicolor]